MRNESRDYGTTVVHNGDTLPAIRIIPSQSREDHKIEQRLLEIVLDLVEGGELSLQGAREILGLEEVSA